MQPFKGSRIAAIIRGIVAKWGGPERCREVEQALRSVKDYPEYLRRVAALGPEAAANLVAAAILGVTIAGRMDELLGADPPAPSPN